MATLSKPRATGQAVRIENATVSFPARAGSLVALHGCSLEVPAGSFTVVIGPNGCGKSTLLRLIAGAEDPDAGAVTRLGGLSLADLLRLKAQGAVRTGIEIGCPNTVVARLRVPTSTRTRGRSFSLCQARRFSRTVSSSPAPPK